jgi:amino acid adenylation domain-containing protein
MSNPASDQWFPPPKDFKPFEKGELQSSLVHRFEHIVGAFPENIAISSDGEKITYRQLNESANLLAREIISRSGVEPHPVAFVLEHGPAPVIALLGILKTGKSYVALDPSFPIERIKQVLEIVGTNLTLTNQKNLSITHSLISNFPGIELLNLDLMDKGSAKGNLGVSIPTDSISYIVFTSGSTGQPKGVIRTHGNNLHDTYTQTNSQQISPNDRYGLFLSISFEASRSVLLGSLLNGATLCLFDPRKYGIHMIPDWLEKERITALLSTPSAFRHMFESVPRNHRFPTIRFIGLGGEAATSRDWEIFNQHFTKKCVLMNTLGSSEAGGLTRYMLRFDSPFPGHVIPSGYPVPDKIIELVDEDNRTVGENQVGEIVVKSPYLSPGYWNNPALTTEKFQTDPDNEQYRIFHTGDLGRWRSDGCLEYLGRKDSQVKIRGYRVEIEEIETVLNQHPAIKDACVTSWTDERYPEEKQIVAYLVPEKPQSPEAEELRKFVAEKLPDYMIPSRIKFLEEIPLTPTGKVNHQALPSPGEIIPVKERLYVAPKDEIESQLVKIWERVLKAKPVGTRDDFFEIGGNSLIAAQLFAQIERAFSKKLPLATLFQAPTVEQQADIIRQEDWTPDWSSLVTLRSGGSKTPLFLAAPVGGNVLSYRDLLMRLDPDQPCYGLQAVGLDGVQAPQRSVPEVASHYVKEILTVQPDGPYYLSGSSFGGLVAYEMAQQLHDMGKPIALVVMFDAYGPNYPTRLPSTSRLRRKVFKVLRRADTHLSNLLFANWKGRWIYLQVKLPKLYLRLSRMFRQRLNQVLNPVPRKLRRIRSAHMGAARREKRYMRAQRRFPGRLVLFRAEKQPLGIYPDPKLGWGAVVGDDIEVYEIPGHHTSIIYQPRVQILAEKMRQILDEVQNNHSGIGKIQ